MAQLLIVDDDEDMADALGDILTGLGHRVVIANDGREGLQRLHDTRPDVVILDVQMPVLSGPEMAWRILIHNAGLEQIPILLVSGIDNFARVVEAVGTPYHMAKPFRLEALLDLLDRALAEQSPPSRHAPRPE